MHEKTKKIGSRTEEGTRTQNSGGKIYTKYVFVRNTSTDVMIHVKLLFNANCSLIVDTKEGLAALPITVIYSVLHCFSVLFSLRRQDCCDTSPTRVICSFCSQMLRLLRNVTYQGNFLIDAKIAEIRHLRGLFSYVACQGYFLASPTKVI